MTDAVAQVRSFNRLVTERVGALNDHYLARDRSLGECRLLWEIGTNGRDVRELRARLDLDSGTSAGCCAHSSAPGWSRSSRATTTGAFARRGSRPPGAPRWRCSTGAATTSPAPSSSHSGSKAGAPRRGDGRGRAPAHGGARPGGRRRSGASRRAALPTRVLRRTGRALRHGVRPRPQHLRRRRRAPLACRRLPAGDASRRAGRLRRAQATRRRARRAQADVGRRRGAGPRAGPAPARRARDEWRRRTARPSSAWRRTGRCARRSASTGRPATARSPRSTTSRTRTTGSRSGSRPSPCAAA